MQIPIELIVVAFLILAMLILLTMGTEYTVPMYVRSNFDNVCNKYLAIIEKDGGLSSDQRSNLRQELETMGIVNVTITAPTQTAWGERVTLIIEGNYMLKTTDYTNLSKSTVANQIHYQESTVMVGIQE